MATSPALSSSFRDPAGFVYEREGALLRQVNRVYLPEYRKLIDTGLYQELVEAGLLIPHREDDLALSASDEASIVLRPERIPFISYPYEWCFGQLRDAALAVLDIQARALAKGMCLKDASAYNVQFRAGKPVLIDTLSFASYVEGAPWVAYRQFCQHFLAPLLLVSLVDARLARIVRESIDGIPLDLASRLLPWRTRFNVHILSHIHVHARAQRERGSEAPTQRRLSLQGLRGILDSLETLIRSLRWQPGGTTWSEYYDQTNYSSEAMEAKEKMVGEFLDSVMPEPCSVWDLGANNGRFSALASRRGIPTVAWDLDPAAIEQCYRHVRESSDPCLLPLVQDLTNPSPALGWAHRERQSLVERGPVDVVLALAVVHHLALGNNVPLPEIASFLARLGKTLVMEFVPKEDSQTQRLLASREDVFPHYSQEGFESAFRTHYEVLRHEQVPGTVRTLYLLERRSGA